MGKKDLAIMQHQACRPLLRDAHKLFPPYMGTERLQTKQWQSLPPIYYSVQRQLARDPSVVLLTAVCSAARWAGEPGNS